MAVILFFFVNHLCLEYSPSGESDESDKEESDKLGSESGSVGTFGAGFDGLLRIVGFPLGVKNLDKLSGLCFRYYASLGFSLEGKLIVSIYHTLP